MGFAISLLHPMTETGYATRMRIVAGIYKNRRLESPKGQEIRPTSERMREAIFNLLSHGKFGRDHVLEEAQVLDICCGSGALGLEALSRGAARVLFIDRQRGSLGLARGNAAKLGAEAKCDFFCCDATQLPPARQPFSLVLMDPPYDAPGLAEKVLKGLYEKGWLAKGAVLAIELPDRAAFALPEGYNLIESRRYSRAQLVLLRYGE